MKKVKLIALDLDGTLLNSNGQISDVNKNAIKKVIAADITVIISTGRPYIGIPLSDVLPLGISYAITANGSAIYKLSEKKCLYEDAIDTKTGCSLLKKLYQHTLHLDAFIDGDAYTQASTRPLIDQLQIPESLRAYIRDTRTVVTNLPAYLLAHKMNIQKLTINFLQDENGNLKERDEVIALLKDYPSLHFVSGGFQNIEINKAGISKADGLRFLCDRLQIPMEHTMVCGDSQNDLDIITAAGTGVAMANSEPILLDAADFVSKSNNEDGVAWAIEQITGSVSQT